MLLSSSLPASDLEEVLLHASEHSRSAESYRLSYENGLLSARSEALDDEMVYSIALEASPLHEDMTGVDVGALSFSLTTPEETEIQLRSPFMMRYDGSGGVYHPGASVSHTFDFGHDDDYLRSLRNRASVLSTERTYRSAILSIRRSVLDMASSIYSADLQIRMEEKELSDLEREMEESLQLGIMSPDSAAASEYDLAIRLSEDNIASLGRQKELQCEAFRSLTGLEWEPFDEIPEPVFALDSLIGSNSEVEEARILSEAASEAYLVEYSDQHQRKLTVGLDAEGTLSGEDLLHETGAGLSGSIGWNGGNWSLSLSGGGSWERGGEEFIPFITVGGTWHSDTTDREDDLYLESLANEELLLRNEYLETLSQYREDLLDAVSAIAEWQAGRERQDNEIAYRRAVFEERSSLYERGLAAKRDVEDASFELGMAEAELDIMKLEGLSLSLSLEALLI